MNKRVNIAFLIAICFVIVSFYTNLTFAQKTSSRASSSSGTQSKKVEKTDTDKYDFDAAVKYINQRCVMYDPYVRKFSYNDKTDILTWVNKDGDITCSCTLSDVSVKAEKSGSDYLVQFKCTKDSKCIECNYGGATKLSSITIKDKTAADEIVTKFISIQVAYLVQSISANLKTYLDNSKTSSNDAQKSIIRINELCKEYDPYKRTFSYTPSTKILKWVSGDGSITCTANISEIDAVTEPSGSNYYVTFKCKDGSKCVESSYSGKTKESAITLTSKSAAEEIVKEFNKIAPQNNITSLKTTGSDIYNTVKIGKQEWMGINLDVEYFRNGDMIPRVTTNEEWVRAGKEHKPAWCYYGNETATGRKYGKLYNWYAVTDKRGLAPKGWHIPTKREWANLISYLGGESAAGERMKEVDSWFKEVKTFGNSFFNALPGGFRYNDGTFDYIGERGKSYYCATFWASEDMADEKGWYIFLANGNETAGSSEVNKIDGLSVRCIKD